MGESGGVFHLEMNDSPVDRRTIEIVDGLERHGCPGAALQDKPCSAAAAVPAHAAMRAVGIEVEHEEVGPPALPENEKAVRADAVAPVAEAWGRLRPVEAERSGPFVDEDEIIAGAGHFGKGDHASHREKIVLFPTRCNKNPAPKRRGIHVEMRGIEPRSEEKTTRTSTSIVYPS